MVGQIVRYPVPGYSKVYVGQQEADGPEVGVLLVVVGILWEAQCANGTSSANVGITGRILG